MKICINIPFSRRKQKKTCPSPVSNDMVDGVIDVPPTGAVHMEGKGKKYEVATGAADPSQCRLYAKRWLILTIFMIYAVGAGMQWMQYSIITNIVTKFYRNEPYMVEWTTMSHMLAYILAIFPALWLLDKFGNRITMLLAALGVCVGSWIKLFAVHPNMFAWVLVGQSIEAAAQVLTFGLSGTVTAAWFSQNEIAFAGSLALFGDQFGALLGFLLPPLVVQDSDDIEIIRSGIFNMCAIVTAITTSMLIIALIFFEDKPKKPPSNAQIVQREFRESRNSAKEFTKVLTSRTFLLVVLTYGIHIGVFCAHATILNRIILSYFPGHVQDAGNIGSIILICGLLGGIIWGMFLDWKHLYKQTSLFLYICSLLTMFTYTFALEYRHLISVYILASLLGIFMLGYYSVGIQMAIEVVYPASEGTTAGLALLAVQLIALGLTPIYRLVFECYTAFEANLMLCGILFVGVVITALIPERNKRQTAENKGQQNDGEISIVEAGVK